LTTLPFSTSIGGSADRSANGLRLWRKSVDGEVLSIQYDGNTNFYCLKRVLPPSKPFAAQMRGEHS
jgi:hypothetical protein